MTKGCAEKSSSGDYSFDSNLLFWAIWKKRKFIFHRALKSPDDIFVSTKFAKYGDELTSHRKKAGCFFLFEYFALFWFI